MYPDLSHAACPSFGVISNTAHRASVAGYQKQSSNFLISLVSTPLLRASKSPLSTVGWGNSAPFVVVRGLPAAFMSYLISPPMRSPRKHSSISGVGWGDIFPASNRPCLPLSRTSVQTSAHSDVWGSVMETSSHCRPVPNPDPCSPPIKCPTWRYTHLTSCGPHPTTFATTLLLYQELAGALSPYLACSLSWDGGSWDYTGSRGSHWRFQPGLRGHKRPSHIWYRSPPN